MATAGFITRREDVNLRRVCSSDLAPLSAQAVTLRRAQHIGMKAVLAFQELPALVSALSFFLPSSQAVPSEVDGFGDQRINQFVSLKRGFQLPAAILQKLSVAQGAGLGIPRAGATSHSSGDFPGLLPVLPPPPLLLTHYKQQ